MAHHYAGTDPDEAAQTQTMEISLENVTVPGSEHNYQINVNLDYQEIMDSGDLIPAERLDALNTLSELSEEYGEDNTVFEIFLGYAENNWSLEEMCINADARRPQVYDLTEDLYEQYGLINVDGGSVHLTDRGDEAHDAFQLLSEDENGETDINF